jgi:hypothetical protein
MWFPRHFVKSSVLQPHSRSYLKYYKIVSIDGGHIYLRGYAWYCKLSKVSYLANKLHISFVRNDEKEQQCEERSKMNKSLL